MNKASDNWATANQRYLTAVLNRVRVLLQTNEEAESVEIRSAKAQEELEAAAEKMPALPALDRLVEIFDLTVFERDLLLLCAGMELDTRFSALCATRQDDPDRPFPTFALGLAVLPEAHWSALLPTSPLRQWRLIDVTVSGAGAITGAPLSIDERILHYLRGMQYMDTRLAGFVRAIQQHHPLAPSHLRLSKRLSEHWPPCVRMDTWNSYPVIQLCGGDDQARESIAAHACDALGQTLWAIRATRLPASASELEAFLRLWEREAVLRESALLLDCHADTELGHTTQEFIDRASFPLIVTTHTRIHPTRPLVTIEVTPPKVEEQHSLWRSTFPATKLNGELNALVGQFNLNPSQISAVGVRMSASKPDRFTSAEEEFSALWDSCRLEARPKLDQLAQRIESTAQWDDLVIPAEQQEALLQIKAQVRQRFKVYEQWGFAGKESRGLGISALLAGPSGTGKTLAAEVIANALQLDLYRIDLSQVVSKYIGETEKNLRRIFDAAETGGAVLLFDECDALFGKRSEVKDSHDRYANIEVSYLLQRMEAYRGLAILTTNMRQAIDPAFLRRIRFVVQFSFPDMHQRTEIWRRVFPIDVPREQLTPELLARLNVTGGNIRNIALGAAFLAAEDDTPVDMGHLLRSAKIECAKIEKPLSDAEVRGWV